MKYYNKETYEIFDYVGEGESRIIQKGVEQVCPAVILKKDDKLISVVKAHFNLTYLPVLMEVPDDMQERLKLSFEKFNEQFGKDFSWKDSRELDVACENITDSYMQMLCDDSLNKNVDRTQFKQTHKTLKSFIFYVLAHAMILNKNKDDK